MWQFSGGVIQTAELLRSLFVMIRKLPPVIQNALIVTVGFWKHFCFFIQNLHVDSLFLVEHVVMNIPPLCLNMTKVNFSRFSAVIRYMRFQCVN